MPTPSSGWSLCVLVSKLTWQTLQAAAGVIPEKALLLADDAPRNHLRRLCAPQYEYLWADGLKVKKPVRLAAPEYINALFDWIETQVRPRMGSFWDCCGISLDIVQSLSSMLRIYYGASSALERSLISYPAVL